MNNTYSGGESPMRGDEIQYTDQSKATRTANREARELWIVISISDGMVRGKCADAHSWKQAFYTDQMRLVKRKS